MPNTLYFSHLFHMPGHSPIPSPDGPPPLESTTPPSPLQMDHLPLEYLKAMRMLVEQQKEEIEDQKQRMKQQGGGGKPFAAASMTRRPGGVATDGEVKGGGIFMQSMRAFNSNRW